MKLFNVVSMNGKDSSTPIENYVLSPIVTSKESDNEVIERRKREGASRHMISRQFN